MRNGDVLKYLKSDQGKFVNKLAVLHQIAEGMEYLHGREIIHGDLKVSLFALGKQGGTNHPWPGV